MGVGDGTAFIWETGTVLVLYMIQGPTEVVWPHSGMTRLSAWCA